MLKTNVFCTGDEHFSVEDERVENVHSKFSHTPLATSDFQTDIMSR